MLYVISYKQRRNIFLQEVDLRRSIKEWIVRMVLLCAGITAVSLGTALLMLAGLGADPFNVFLQGLSHFFTFDYGFTCTCISALLCLILIFTKKHALRAGAWVCTLLYGPMTEFFVWVLAAVESEDMYFPVRFLVMTSACLILVFGRTVAVQADVGIFPYDLVPVMLCDRLHCSRRAVALAAAACFTAAGVLLGGIFGIGTLASVFAAEAASGYFMPVTAQLVSLVLEVWGKTDS